MADKPTALKAEAALAAFIVESPALWDNDKRILEQALGIIREAAK